MRTGLTIVVAAYWLALFAATHLPIAPVATEAPGTDKWLHLTAYTGLAFLIAARQSCGRSLTWKTTCGIVAAVALYGIMDELTQIPVGRDAEIGDWLADVTGSVVGVTVFTLIRAGLARRRSGPTGRLKASQQANLED